MDVLAGRVAEKLDDTAGARRHVVFTAHSLPHRILADDDPYRDQLLETARLVAGRAGLPRRRWSFAFQSESPTGEAWLGPDILAELDRLHAQGVDSVLVAPIGFVADHLEILWDLDIEARERADQLGLELERTPSLNDDPDFIRALAGVVRRRSTHERTRSCPDWPTLLERPRTSISSTTRSPRRSSREVLVACGTSPRRSDLRRPRAQRRQSGAHRPADRRGPRRRTGTTSTTGPRAPLYGCTGAGSRRYSGHAATERRHAMPKARDYPYTRFNFRVQLDGVASAAFGEVTGLDSVTEVIEYRTGDSN